MTVYPPCKRLIGIATAGLLAAASAASAEVESYRLDPAHSFVNFSIPHLGVSMLQGRFNTLEGGFTYNPQNPAESEVTVTIDTASVDSNHAERDKHLRGPDFLNVEEFPEARFESTSFEPNGDGATLNGNLTLNGVTKPIQIDVAMIGAGEDPWGGYRRGYVGRTTLRRSDFGISYDLGPAAAEMEIELNIEGIRM